MAERSLDFFAEEMVTDLGAYHYKKADSTKGVRGSLLDNAYLLLAFVEGYNVLGKSSYRAAAEQLADYSLANLYDWNSGGFFERNSPDTELYAPGEELDLGKPTENGVIAYAMLKLYKETDDVRYLNAGLKTLGAKLGEVGGLDRGYYYAKAAEFILAQGLLDAYAEAEAEIAAMQQQEQEKFWLNPLLEKRQSPPLPTAFVVAEEGLGTLQSPLLLLLIVALVAGFISFASPCTLPILPAYLAYSFKSSKHNIKGMTVSFFLGLSIVFTLLGMSATFVGSFLESNLTLFSQVAGIAIMFFGLYMLLGKGFGGVRIKAKKPSTYAGAFLFGSAMGISWTPCVGPILVAILLLASTTSSAISGGLLLFSYGVGLALPLLLVSLYLQKSEGKIWRLLHGKELKVKLGSKIITTHTNTLISGVLFLVLGYLIFSGILYSFNQYITTTGFQKFIFQLEEWLLQFVR